MLLPLQVIHLYGDAVSQNQGYLECIEGRFQLPSYAKFNRPDPQRDWDWLRPHTLNLYEYCSNDPVNNWDPTGLEWNNESGSVFLTIFETHKDDPEKLAQVETAYVRSQKEAGKIAVEIVADTYGDAFELVTGTTITGDPGNRGMAAVAIMVPFASSATLKGVGNLVEVATDAGRKGSVEGTVMNQLQGAANAALKNVGEGKGAVHGTHVHTNFKTQVDSLGNTDLHTEVSYKNGQIVPYSTKGSVRPDIVEGSILAPHTAHDLKTGKAKVTKKQIQKIKQHIPSVQKVEEIKPQYKE